MQQTVELWEEGANNEELAYERQKSEGIKHDLIGVWSCQNGGSF